MEQKLGTFRKISQRFILIWCLIFLIIAGISNFSSLFQAGPKILKAQDAATYVVRTYPECAGEPGMVHDVDAMSDGTYQTSNPHFQTGVCGDTPQPTQSQPVSPTYQSAPESTSEQYQCEGGHKVYYKVYINVVKPPEKTGRVEYNHPNCAGQTTQNVNSSYSRPISSGLSDLSRSYPSMTASCVASPSQARVGDSVTWQVQTSGGSGSFKYHWKGDNSVNGQTDRILTTSYQTAGTRTAQVEIIDRLSNQKITTDCIVSVTSPVTPTSVAYSGTPMYQNYPVYHQPQIQVINSQPVQCPAGTTEKSRSGTQLVCERPQPIVTTINATNLASCPAGTTEKGRVNGVIQCEQSQPSSVVVLATPTPQPQIINTAGAVVFAPTPVQCPSGTLEKSRTSAQVVCERQLAQTAATQLPQTTSQSEVKVLGTHTSSIRELPRTGLPLVAIGIGALGPVGWRIKKMFGVKKAEESAHDIWLQKQLS